MSDFIACEGCPHKAECKAKGCYQEEMYNEEQAGWEQEQWEREQDNLRWEEENG